MESVSPQRPSLPRFPLRVGITWRKGERLEAMDRTLTWYPSKIVDINEEEKMVLIHFEGWNQRYDEWLGMDSDKLRPTTRHSERKEKTVKKRRVHNHPIYRPGERILAKWTDCKKYPAKVNRQMEDGSYEVIFYDGVSMVVQTTHMQPFPEIDQPKPQRSSEKLNPSSHKATSSFKSIKLKLPESVTRKLNKPRTSMTKGKLCRQNLKLQNMRQSSVRLSPLKSMSMTQRLTSSQLSGHRPSRSLNLSSPNRSESPLKRSPHVIGMDPASSTEVPILTPVDPQSQLSHSSTCADTANTTSISTADSTGEWDFREGAIKVKISLTEDRNAEMKSYISHFSEMAVNVPRKRGKKRHKTGTGLDMKRRKRPKLKSSVETLPPKRNSLDTLQASSLETGLPPGAAVPLPLGYRYELFAPQKAFVVQEDHNPFKCTHEGCSKGFRKEALLTSHIRFYHSGMDGTPAGPSSSPHGNYVMASPSVQSLVPSSLVSQHTMQHTPQHTTHTRKRRKKTSSICSTDSDMSVSSKGGKSSSKRKRNDSEISVTTASPDLASRDLWPDVRHKLEDSTLEIVETEEEDNDQERDMVNCVCGTRDTGGLMIQCDVCMCWQHFACVDTKGRGEPPANYVCSICENTPGIRDSSRHLHDMSWERRGELPAFPFTSEKSSPHLASIARECNQLIGTLQSMKSVLHSTRRQIKISKEEEDPEFQLWQTDWDNWVKPEEDLLTPRSTDPAPSPTPSTFLFPPARGAAVTSETVGATAAVDVTTAKPNLTVNTEPSTTHFPLTLNTNSSDISVSTSAPTNSENLVNVDTLSPPLTGGHRPPQSTPQSVRSRQAILAGGAGGLVRDLFPGPGGDADTQTHRQLDSVNREEVSGVCHGTDVTSHQVRTTSPAANSHLTHGDVHLLNSRHSTEETSAVSPPVSGPLVNGKLNGVHSRPSTLRMTLEEDRCEGVGDEPASPTGAQSEDLDVADDRNAFDDLDDNDTDTAEESTEAYRHCEMNLLEHVSSVHGDIEAQLEMLENQIINLESTEQSHPSIQLSEDNILNDVPALKKSLGKLSYNLSKIHRLSLYH